MRPDGAYDQTRLNMVGEALLVVEFGAKLTPALNDAVLAFDHYIEGIHLEGLCERVPTGNSVALHFDPLRVEPAHFRQAVTKIVAAIDWFSAIARLEPKRWRLPVCYGGEAGPDLSALSKQLNMTVEEVINAHQLMFQRVLMMGFAPGFLYTGMLPEIFNVPRSSTIKPVVPVGSISVAIGQTVISSTPHPTGWHTIGRTPLVNFEPQCEPPVRIVAGDEIEFYAIDQSEFERLQREPDQGLRQVEGARGRAP